MHSDGVQATGKIPVDVVELGVDLYSISGHKFYAPKGAGALYRAQGNRRSRRCCTAATMNATCAREPRTLRERSGSGARRSGSWNEVRRSGSVRLRCATGWSRRLLDRSPDSHVNGAGAPRTPNTTNMRFDGIDSDALLIALDLKGFAVSSGSACSSGATEPSHVLVAIGLTPDQARSSLRFSLGRSNSTKRSRRVDREPSPRASRI